MYVDERTYNCRELYDTIRYVNKVNIKVIRYEIFTAQIVYERRLWGYHLPEVSEQFEGGRQ